MQARESFGRWLRARRRELDLSREALARQIGCAVVTLKKIEADERRPSRAFAERLLAILAVAPEEQPALLRMARATPALAPRPAQPAAAGLDLEALPGQTIKGYTLHECVGQGGFGAVFRAEQPAVGREVAMKLILPRHADQPDFIRRFESEARLIARLEHPYIVPLYDYWREPGGAYLVMRYLRGGTLHALIRQRPLERDSAARLIEQIGGGLATAHRQGVIHRDLKPTNVLLDAEHNFYLADFGIAKDLDDIGAPEQTTAGAVVGSPAYLSPEQIRAEPVTPRTDIYSLGIVLYEALAGAKPFGGSTPVELIWQHLNTPLPSLRDRRPDLPAAIGSVLQRATAKQPADRYAEVDSLVADALAALGVRSASGRLLRAEHSAPTVSAQATAALDLLDQDNPYKGLRAFGEADAGDFFGRDALVARLLERLAEDQEPRTESQEPDLGDKWRMADDEGVPRHPSPPAPHLSRFLAVVGPSGSGKSSAVRAGLIPALRRGGLPGSEQWFIADMRPGAHPLDELELALLRVAPSQPAHLREQLDRDERGLLRAARMILPDDESELLLIIDQFEELFTLVDREPVRARFLDSLLAAVTDPRGRVRVIVTLRADFYDRPLRYADLGELVRQRTEVVLPLAAEELAEAIVGPAGRAGLTLEPGLVTTIVGDVAEQPGALPLLQYALTELFARRVGRVLPLAAYVATGGVAGALARRANALYARLDPSGQTAARQLFLRLVTPGDGVEDTRRRVRLSELATTDDRPSSTDSVDLERPPVVGRQSSVVELYDRYRLLTFDHDPLTREPTVEVAHEALIRAWDRLRGWLDESRDQLRLRHRLTADATEWARAGHETSFLAGGARLSQYKSLAESDVIALNAAESTFLAASAAEHARKDAAEREQQQRERMLQRRATNRLRALVGALAVFLVVALILTAAAIQQRGQAQANFTRAEAQRLAAESNRLLVENGSAETIALLALRSLRLEYTAQGDIALGGAAALEYPRRVFSAHSGRIATAIFSPDGKQVVTSGIDDKTIRVWDAQTGAQVRALAEPAGPNELAFSPTGRLLAIGCEDGTIRLWDPQTGQQIRVLSGHTARTLGIAFSPDARTILSESEDKTARLWDAQTGSELRRFPFSGAANAIAFAADGRTVLFEDDHSTMTLWDIQTGKPLRRILADAGSVNAIAFSPDATQALAASSDQTAHIWDLQAGRDLRVLSGHTDQIGAVAYSADGRFAATGSTDLSVRLWDAQTGAELRRYIGHTGNVFTVAFSPDGAYLLSSSYDGTALLWDVREHAGLPRITGQARGVWSVAYAPDGSTFVTGAGDGTARMWDAHTGAELQRLAGHSDALMRVAYSPDGRMVATGSLDDTARLWDARTGRELRVLRGHPGDVTGIAFSPDSRYLLTSSWDNIRLWDAQAGTELRRFQSQSGGAFEVAFSPDGRTIVSSDFSTVTPGIVREWDAQTGQELRSFTPSPDHATIGVAFSPDGKQILAGSDDNIIRLLDAQTGAELRRFVGHSDIPWQMSFSPSGRYILSASLDKTARIWDAQTGRELRRLGHNGRLYNGSFSPDERSVLTGALDGTARLWDVDYHDTIAALCGRLLRDFSDGERAQYGIPDDGPTCPK